MKNRHRSVIIFFVLFMATVCRAAEDRTWIFFTDKGYHSSDAIDTIAKKYLSTKSIDRRAKKSIPIDYDFTDLPLEISYINKLKQLGIKIIHRSKWFNGVSAIVSTSDYSQIRQLPFVKTVEPVQSFKFSNPAMVTVPQNHKINDLDYGPSFNQNNMLGIPDFHKQGYNGSGIRIAIFDTGFKLTHEALQSVNVLATWDFIEGDGDVSGFPGETHGAQVLGVLAGYSPGNLVGPAYGAEFVLGKTDDYYTETHVDEDNWVAAAEWADSLGADIISSSVGYNIFDPGEGDYTYQDMNGNTTLVTRAADLAVKKGIVVFTSAGNEGNNSWHHIIAPADGDSVIAVGSVSASGVINASSSRGPTFDGRIKPDVVAQGSSVRTVAFNNDISFSTVSGTSFSTPLAAGAGALVLSAIPSLMPMQLYDSLITYASNHNTPDNDLGYGIVNIKPILQHLLPGQDQISQLKVYPNPFSEFVKIDLKQAAKKSLTIFNLLGQKIKSFTKNETSFFWYGTSDENQNIASGIYFVVLNQNNSIYVKKLLYIRLK